MSENDKTIEGQDSETAGSTAEPAAKSVKLKGLVAFKLGMTSIFSDSGELVPVTVLKYEPLFISQIKSKGKDGYEAVQLAGVPTKEKNARSSQIGHDKASGFENGARFHRELRLIESQEDLSVGQAVSIESFSKGDHVKLTGFSKGRGFSGVVRRWDFAGGPASHGSGFHRTPGSIGNRTWPGRVIAGKKMAGRWGNEKVSLKSVEIVDVLPGESVILVKGPVPGSRNSLVQMVKV